MQFILLEEERLELWFYYFGYEKIKNNVAKQFREVLLIDSGEIVYFKDNKQSIVDKSTLRNAETYSFKKQRMLTYNEIEIMRVILLFCG